MGKKKALYQPKSNEVYKLSRSIFNLFRMPSLFLLRSYLWTKNPLDFLYKYGYRQL